MINRAKAFRNLRSRRDPENMLLFEEAYAKIEEDEAVKYLSGAMEPVQQRYTEITIEQGERIKKQVTSGLAAFGLVADYEYQGSVIKNTHILAYSDIDLLVVDKRFETHETWSTITDPYQGNPTAELLQIRKICKEHLEKEFPKATVDASGAKSVKISGGSLSRTVDVVTANWHYTNEYFSTYLKHKRGVEILNAHVPDRLKDWPFIHVKLIDDKDINTRENAKRLIRLLKSIKYDSDRPDSQKMSSFDIESIVYCMPDTMMMKDWDEQIPLAYECWRWLHKVESEEVMRNKLTVPDGRRKIFAKATLDQLTALREDLEEILKEVQQGLANSLRQLKSARTRRGRPW